jgi:hypothetical protein
MDFVFGHWLAPPQIARIPARWGAANTNLVPGQSAALCGVPEPASRAHYNVGHMIESQVLLVLARRHVDKEAYDLPRRHRLEVLGD